MTQISEIHGIKRIAANEMQDRGRMAAASNAVGGYIPYTSLTAGEMKMALYGQQLAIYAAAFPELKEIKKAQNLVDNALNSGLSMGVKFTGALHSNYLQNIAMLINNASKQVNPASKGGLVGRKSLNGVKIGEFESGEQNCYLFAEREANRKFGLNKPFSWYENNLTDIEKKRFYLEKKQECTIRLEIQNIVNKRITDASHHVIYYDIKEDFPAIKNSTVVTKHLLHTGGIFGISNATEISPDLIKLWTETSVLKKNTIANVGPYGSVESSFNLSPNYTEFSQSYKKWKNTGVFTPPSPKKDKIGEPFTIAALTALIVAIAGAVTAAASFQRELNAKKNGAMSAAQNYGTPALQAKQSDWNNFQGDGSGSNNLATFALLGAGAFFLLSDNEK